MMRQIRRLICWLILFSFLLSDVVVKSSEKTEKLNNEQKIIHVLNRLSFGPRPGDIERVKAIGIDRYIELQLNPEMIDDSFVEAKLKSYEVLRMTTAELFMKYPNPGAVLRYLAQKNGLKRKDLEKDTSASEMRDYQQQVAKIYREHGLGRPNEIMQQVIGARLIRAIYSERQLYEVMVDFWANHFNVYSGKGAVRWYIPSYERDVIRKHALGNFKDLLLATAQHPAMLFYLDNFESTSRNPEPEAGIRRFRQVGGQLRRTRGINENYARELLELHTLGVDGGYTQQDIIEVAKCFTGWTIAEPRGFRKSVSKLLDDAESKQINRIRRLMPESVQPGEFYFNERWHEKGVKYVLGHKINEGGIKDGLKVIEILANHPSTAKHIARKLAIRFVSDNPSEAIVNRVAKVFRDSKGDIKATLRALFTDPEFFSKESYKAKVKTPFEFAVSAMRAVGADVTPNRILIALLNRLGELPYGYQAPTGYPDTADEWVSAGALLERMNFAIALASNRIPQVRVNLERFSAQSQTEILSKVIAEIINGEISEKTRDILFEQIKLPLKDVDSIESIDEQEVGRQKLRLLEARGNPEVFKAVSLVLGTPEFQRQ
ncbi:MAG: DUF1800 domain-containing protein [Pyrinomonadaceae bacterium]|nr:DUF1800 domain-containing protein [Pyrinomonadaceae bacterium]